MDELRLIANPIHLISSKNNGSKVSDHDTDFTKAVNDMFQAKYKNVYLSDLNFKEIHKLIDDYIDDLLIQRIVSDCLTKLIEDTIDSSDKFDFCLPFD